MSSDARERAVRVLADYDARRADNEIARAHRCAEALRALLASEPAKAPFVSRNEEWGLRPDFTTAGVTAPPAGAEVREAAERLHPYADWHEDDGTVLWYAVPVEEPPYCGEPLCSDWPKEWNAPYDTVTGAFIDGPYTGKVLMWQRLPELPPLTALRGGQKGGE